MLHRHRRLCARRVLIERGRAGTNQTSLADAAKKETVTYEGVASGKTKPVMREIGSQLQIARGTAAEERC
jgi:hypothetical protein